MFKKFFVACLLLISANLYGESKFIQIEINEDKGIERHSFYFGNVNIHSSRFLSYRVTNTGTTPLQFQKTTISGIGYFSHHNCNGLINPKGQCQITIQYFPYVEGYHVGLFRLTFDQGYEILINLLGKAIQ